MEQLRNPLSLVADMLEDTRSYIPADTGFPVAHWQRLRWNNRPEWLGK